MISATGRYIHFADDDDSIDFENYSSLINDISTSKADIIIAELLDSSGVMSNSDFLKWLPSTEFSTDEFSRCLIISDFQPLQVQQFLFNREWLIGNKISFPDTFLAEDISFIVCGIFSSTSVAKSEALIYRYLSRSGSTKSLDTPQAALDHLVGIKHVISHINHRIEAKGAQLGYYSSDRSNFICGALRRLFVLYLVRAEKLLSSKEHSLPKPEYMRHMVEILELLSPENAVCGGDLIDCIPKELAALLEYQLSAEKHLMPIEAFRDRTILSSVYEKQFTYIVCYGPLGQAVAKRLTTPFLVIDDRAKELSATSEYRFNEFTDLATLLQRSGNHLLLICNPNVEISKRIQLRLSNILEIDPTNRSPNGQVTIIDVFSDITESLRLDALPTRQIDQRLT